MAFQNVNVSNTMKATAMEVGSSVEGYVARFEASRMVEGQQNIILQTKDGEQLVFFTAGNIKYMINDGKIREGLYTRITRNEDKKVKGGKVSSQFTVEQDPEDSIGVGSLRESVAANVTNNAPAALSAKTSIKDQAAKLAGTIGKRG